MPDFDLISQAQVDELRALIRAGGTIDACELIVVRLPGEERHYAYAQFDRMPNFREGLAARGIEVIASKTSGYFLDLALRDEVEEDTIPVELLDHDGSATAIFQQHGAGHQVEVYFYVAQIDVLISVWWGHLRPPREGGGNILKCSASAGFRNHQVPIPRRVLFAGCGGVFGGLMGSQAEITANKSCDFNEHVGGGRGVPGALALLGPCPQDSRARCQQYMGDDLSYVAADTIAEAIINNNRGGALLAWSKGNETNLKEALRVIFGVRKVRDLQVSAYTRQVNTSTPDKGFVRVLMPVCEGLIAAMWECAVNDRVIGFEHLNVRLGGLRQPRTGFSPNVSNMSWTAHFFGVWGQVDASQYSASNLRGSCRVQGLADIRVYSTDETYAEQYTTNRAWCLMEVLRNRRWGRGYKDDRFVVADWRDLAAWCAEQVTYKTADGTVRTATRSTYNAELVGRPGSEQIKDICLFGRFGKPFRHNGKVRIVPLRRATQAELDDAPVFTDEGPDANVVITSAGSQLFWSQIDAAELTNQVELRFEDAAYDNVERPLTIKDVPAQKAAAAALGDTGVHVVSKPYSASGAGGVTSEGEAIRLGWMLLNLGEFDEGGLKNNLRVWFTTHVFEALNLRKYQVIKVVSSKIAGFGFQYFRVMERTRQGDLYAKVTVQAYPVSYYEEMEQPVVEEGGDDGGLPVLPLPGVEPNPGGRPGERPEAIGFQEIEYRIDGSIAFKLQQSAL